MQCQQVVCNKRTLLSQSKIVSNYDKSWPTRNNWPKAIIEHNKNIIMSFVQFRLSKQDEFDSGVLFVNMERVYYICLFCRFISRAIDKWNVDKVLFFQIYSKLIRKNLHLPSYLYEAGTIMFSGIACGFKKLFYGQ